MEFNVSKCKMMHHGKDIMLVTATIWTSNMEEVECEKGLGVIFYQDLEVFGSL